MLENKLIIIPIEGEWDHSADFLRQTAITLSKKNKIIIYDQENSYFFLKKRKIITYPKIKNISFQQTKYFLPFRRFTFLERINRKLSWKLLLAKNYKKDKVTWFFYPNYFDLAEIKDKKTISIYDCVDYSEKYEKEKLLIKNVDYFFVNSLILKELHKDKDKQPTYISSQGFFKPDQKKIKTLKLNCEKPIVGLVGGINYRLNFKLLNSLIKKNQQWQFIFYGPKQENKIKDKIFKTKFWINKISKYKNVTLGQSSDRYDVYSIIENFDLAIIPYNIDIPFNRYCYPMKIFEYFYFGKKVVSCEIEELKLQKFKNFIKLAEKEEDWRKAIEESLKNKLSKKQIKKEKNISIQNSWKKKIEKISKFIFFN